MVCDRERPRRTWRAVLLSKRSGAEVDEEGAALRKGTPTRPPPSQVPHRWTARPERIPGAFVLSDIIARGSGTVARLRFTFAPMLHL